MFLAQKKILWAAVLFAVSATMALACNDTAPTATDSQSKAYTYTLYSVGGTGACCSASGVGGTIGCTLRNGVQELGVTVKEMATLTREGVEHTASALHQAVALHGVAEGSAGAFDKAFTQIAKTASTVLRTVSSFFSGLGSAIWPF